MSLVRSLLSKSISRISAFGAIAVASVALATEITYYDEDLPSSLNPLYATTMVDYRAQELYFDRLYYTDPVTNAYKSRLVKSYEITSTNPYTIRLTLIDGLKWHNGLKVTAKDVCFTIDAMLDEGTPSEKAEVFRQFFTSCKVHKEMIADVVFQQVDYNPPARLNFALLPSSEFDSTAILPTGNDFGTRPIGSGPMKGAKGSRTVLFEAHNNTIHHKPKLTSMKLMRAGDPQLQVVGVQNGEVHGIISVPPSYRPTLRASSEVSLKNYDLRSWWYIAINTKHPALSLKEVRQGLNYILNRNELREYTTGVKKGEKDSPCEFISGPFVQSSPYYNRAIPVVENSQIAKADSLFKRAGLAKEGGVWQYNGSPIELRIGMKASLNKEAPDLLAQIGNQLTKAGIKPFVDTISSDDWRREVETGNATDKYDLVIGKWSFGLDENVNDIFHTRTDTTGSRNIFNYSNQEVDTLLTDFENARREDAAKDAYHKLHETLADDLPYLFLWKLDTKSAWRKEIRNNLITPYYYFTVVDDWSYSGE